MRLLKLLLFLPFLSCIQTDIEDPFEPTLRITSNQSIFLVSSMSKLEAEYTDHTGEPADVPITWASSDPSVLSIDKDIATAVSEGLVLITASAENISVTISGEVTSSADSIPEEVENRSGTLSGTGYDISGSFSLSKNENDELILIVEDYTPDGPGPYFYLTNQDNNVANGLNLGDADRAGNYEINITAINTDIALTTYQYLMVWCEPFGVRLGVGEFSN